MIAKRLDSAYREGRRTRDWLKVKTEMNDEFVVAGYTRGSGRRAGTFGSLVLAVNEGDELRYVGNVGTGFDDAEIRKLLALLEPLRRKTSPFAGRAEAAARPQGRRALGRAAARRAGALRRVDARRPSSPPRLPRHPRGQERRRRSTARSRLQDVIRKGKRELRLSNLDKPFWPDEGITQGRPAALLPGGRAGARAAPARPPVHDAAVPRRRLREGVLPEGRADAHAGLDPDAPRARHDA